MAAKYAGHNRLEWGLLALIGLVCVVLSLLQYRWTGEMSRAERVRLRAGLNDQAARLAHEFDEDIREACRALLPSGLAVQEQGLDGAARARYQQWVAKHDKALFSQVGFAVPEGKHLRLRTFGADGGLTTMDWPVEWTPLREVLELRLTGEGVPPRVPPDSTLLEFPVFREDEAQGEFRELAWAIFEVSEPYVRLKRMPALVREYIQASEGAVYDVSVERGSYVVYSSRADGRSVSSGSDITTGLFSLDNNPRGGGRRKGKGGGQGGRMRWTLSVRHSEGSLEAAVRHARLRNLVASFALLGLLGGAAGMLVRYTARSRRLADMQFRFAAGVSHDLRTPLTAIRGAAFNLADGVVEPERVGSYARLIMRNADELTAMIENVLAFSATLHKDAPQRSDSFDVGDLLEHAAAAMAHETERAGCKLELTLAPELPVLTGDSTALELAFRNLIANAVRHAAQGKWIGVSAAAAAEGGVEIRVSDRGPGVPERERERIFEPFYRGESNKNGLVQGTGLGLSLVKNTVERHGGTVAVKNSGGGGAQFVVHLPAARMT